MADPFVQSLTLLEGDRPRRALGAMGLAGVLLAGWCAWFFGAPVTLYESSLQARLEVATASHPLQASVSGIVVRSTLQLDRWVKAGEVLVELDATNHQLALTEAREEQASLREQLTALEREVAAEERVLTLLHESGRLAQQEASAKRRERQVVASHAGRKAEKLARLKREGHISELDFLDARASARREQASLQAMRAASRSERRRHQTVEEDRRALLEKLNGALMRTRGEVSASTAKIERLEHEIEQHKLRATVSGRLGEVVPLAPGRYLKEGERVATIVPQGQLGAVASFSPAVALGRIRRSQPARVRLVGFPWLQYGSIPATVRRVASEIRDGTVRVELELHPVEGSPIPLQHGLPAEVEVEIDKVTPAKLVLRVVGKMVSGDATTTTSPSSASGT